MTAEKINLPKTIKALQMYKQELEKLSDRLYRKRDKEVEKIEKQYVALTSVEDLQEAYGYGDITEKQLEDGKKKLDDLENSKLDALETPLAILQGMILTDIHHIKLELGCLEEDVRKEAANRDWEILKHHDKAFKIEELMDLTGMSNRRVRKCISDERREGWPIINLQDGNGYYLGSREEVSKQIKLIRHRAFDLIKTARKLECFMKKSKAPEQGELFGA